MIDENTWKEVPKAAIKAAFESFQPAKDFLLAIKEEVTRPVYYNPDAKLFSAEGDIFAIPKSAHTFVPTEDMGNHPGVWLLVKTSGFGDVTTHDVFGPIGHAAGWKPNAVTRAMGGPNTLTASLGSGLLGAGLGYGAGWVTDRLLFKKHREPGEKSRLPWVGAALGGLAGAAPAAWAGYRGWFKDPSGLANKANELGPYTDSPLPHDKISQSEIKTLVDQLVDAFPEQSLREKSADIFSGSGFNQSIPVDRFNKVIWEDDQTPANMRAATSGLIEGASALRSGAGTVSPSDIARIAVGMGSGYLSGLVVGKTLGALAGIPNSAQRSLQQAGIWAGLINNVVPIAFGAKSQSYMDRPYGQ